MYFRYINTAIIVIYNEKFKSKIINLKNKYFLVTECNGHIGYKISTKLKAHGTKVIGIDVKNEKKTQIF